MVVEVRAELNRVCEYKGYRYYRFEDKNGNFLFGAHVQSNQAEVYFSGADVTFDGIHSQIVVRSRKSNCREVTNMTNDERDMLQFAVWLIFFESEGKGTLYGHSKSEWIKLWNKILER